MSRRPAGGRNRRRLLVGPVGDDYGPHMSAPLRVVFADDNYLVREGVGALLAEIDGIEVIETVADPQALLKAVAEHQPDAVLTDIRMPPTHTNEGILAAKRIRSENPRIGVVVLSQYVEEEYAFELLSDGVAGLGYLLKERVTDLEDSRRLDVVGSGGERTAGAEHDHRCGAARDNQCAADSDDGADDNCGSSV